MTHTVKFDKEDECPYCGADPKNWGFSVRNINGQTTNVIACRGCGQVIDNVDIVEDYDDERDVNVPELSDDDYIG